jgi:hypothetical protein
MQGSSDGLTKKQTTPKEFYSLSTPTTPPKEKTLVLGSAKTTEKPGPLQNYFMMGPQPILALVCSIIPIWALFLKKMIIPKTALFALIENKFYLRWIEVQGENFSIPLSSLPILRQTIKNTLHKKWLTQRREAKVYESFLYF